MVEECKSGRLTRDIWPQPPPGSSITTKLAAELHVASTYCTVTVQKQ